MATIEQIREWQAVMDRRLIEEEERLIKQKGEVIGPAFFAFVYTDPRGRTTPELHARHFTAQLARLMKEGAITMEDVLTHIAEATTQRALRLASNFPPQSEIF